VIRRFAIFLFVVMTLAYGLSFMANRTPHTGDEIVVLTDRLFEFGAVSFVHGTVQGDPLFACVARGDVLSPEQSDTYRQAYQAALLDRQALFVRLDADLRLETDYCMDLGNNVGRRGIGGRHDQHDLSAQANLRDLVANLAGIETALTLKRALLANDILKDLTDLMVHMAPAIHSVGTPGEADLSGLPKTVATPYAAFYDGAKRAQFAAVNSPTYWQGVAQMQAGYAQIVQWVEAQLGLHNGPALHALSGRWLSLQTVAPRLSGTNPSAAHRAENIGVCAL